MREVSLERPRILPLIGQGIATRVTQHVRMRLECQSTDVEERFIRRPEEKQRGVSGAQASRRQ